MAKKESLMHVKTTLTDSEGNTGSLVGDIILGTPTPPPSDEVLKVKEYMGCFRLQPDDAGLVGFAYGGITARRNANGKLSFFMGINDQSWPGTVIEIEDPEVYSKNWETSPQAPAKIHWWDSICQGRKGTWIESAQRQETIRGVKALILNTPIDKRAPLLAWLKTLQAKTQTTDPTWYEFGPGQAPIGGLHWDEATKVLYWSYADAYNVAGRPDWCIGATKFNDDETLSAHGPWRPSNIDDGYNKKGSWASGLFAKHPNGDWITGTTIQSGNAGSPWGPDAITGKPIIPIDHDPMVDYEMPTRLITHRYMGGMIDQEGVAGGPIMSMRRRYHNPLWENFGGGIVMNINPAHYNGMTSWRQVDVITGIEWLEYNNKKSLLFWALNSGSKSQDPNDPAAAHEWYSNPGNNYHCPNHGILAPVQITGPVCTHTLPVLISYKIPDIEKIVNGEILPYEAEYESYQDLEDEFGVRIGPSYMMAPGFNGGYFDRDRGYYFLVSQRAENITVWGAWSSLIHVFKMG